MSIGVPPAHLAQSAGMIDSLDGFREVMLISGVTSAGLVALLLLLTVWRGAWGRLLKVEERLWRKVGVKGNWIGAFRRVEGHPWLISAIGGLLVLHLGLFALSSVAYAHFHKRLQKKSVPVLTQPTRSH